MTQVSIIVDGGDVRVSSGERLLWALLDAGIWVPNLCAIRGVEPPHGGCRLCWVEIDGREKPITSCTVQVQDRMVVHTRTPRVDRLVRASFEMLLSNHQLDCKYCPGNQSCALQRIAKERKIPLKSKRLSKIEPNFPKDESRKDLGVNPNHCVLCGKCVYVCNHEVNKGILDIAYRGLIAVVSTFDDHPLAEQDCGDCIRCAEVCPVGAIYLRKGIT